jgi:ubiquinone/menaquinone biosynthesis C-methylase UbiE
MFGAETSIKKCLKRNGARWTTADLFDKTADIKVDIQDIQFPDESFSLITCNHVLEHVPDYNRALQELRRVLKKSGILELTVPTNRSHETVFEDASITSKDDRTKYFGQCDHLRVFGNDFAAILSRAGFEVEVIDGAALPSEINAVIGPARLDDNRVYICRKA